MADDDYRRAIAKHRWTMQLPAELICRGQVLVAEMHRSIAAVATVLPSGQDVELEGLFVEPSLWRKGIGRKLVAELPLFRRTPGYWVWARMNSLGERILSPE